MIYKIDIQNPNKNHWDMPNMKYMIQ
jgi:hypothetical protein